MNTTSYDTWQNLACLFASKSWAQIMQLKEDPTLIQWRTRTVSDFFHAFKVIIDELSLIDSPVQMVILCYMCLMVLALSFKIW